jgi:hypothetical protein
MEMGVAVYAAMIDNTHHDFHQVLHILPGAGGRKKHDDIHGSTCSEKSHAMIITISGRSATHLLRMAVRYIMDVAGANV